MICQDIPGLRYTVGIAEAGLCVDADNAESVVEGITQIDGNYKYYSQRASKLYESIDTMDQVSMILNSLSA